MAHQPRDRAGERNQADEETPLLSESGNAPRADTPVLQHEQPVTWASMPNKGQLAILVFARLAEPLSERSLTSYLYYQLGWFNPSLEPSELASQAGHLTAIFAAAQCLTSMWWGRAADSPLLGRKRVLMMGLFGAAISALGMGFAPSFQFALLLRFMAGALNGNVGVLRTMISEIILDKRYQSRAFLLLPMCFNFGVIIGPLMSGYLADPINSLPDLFGPGSSIGGPNGVRWMRNFPYALPNIVCASILIMSAFAVFVGLNETHPQLKGRMDPGRAFGRLILHKILRKPSERSLPEPRPESTDTKITRQDTSTSESVKLRDIFTTDVKMTMLQHFLQALHVSTFNSVLFVLLPSPIDRGNSTTLPFWFSGGLGLSSKKLALVNTTIGFIGIPMQLFVYPQVNARLGSLMSYRAFLPLSIITYIFIPYLVVLPDNIALIWTCLTALLAIHLFARVFVTPASILLVNESSPSPIMLGTIHGFASSVSSASRIIGPTAGGTLLGWGLSHNIVGLPFWTMGLIACVNWFVLRWVVDARE
ncbi:Major facilitator superfamily multidrug transporter mfsB [Paramyrothecium foliicola]|nr:Major facilitator superfamily multidrug transporter mfsB [Paramyrothecium foliicola]